MMSRWIGAGSQAGTPGRPQLVRFPERLNASASFGGTKAECAPPADANSVRSCRKNSRHVLAIWKRSLPSEALERQTAVGRQREWPVLPDTIVLGRRQARADIPRCDVASALLDRDDRGVSYAHPRVVLCLLGGEWRPFCLLDAGDL